MKILLISVNNEKDPYPVAPIGAAYVAGALKKNGHNVRLLDLCFAEDAAETVRASLKEFRPDIIGISIRNIDNLTCNRSVFYMPGIRVISALIKDLTDVPVVVGGSGFSLFPEEVLRYLELEIGIVGEGEKAFTSLVNALRAGENLGAIPNLCCLDNGVFRANAVCYGTAPVWPDRSLLDNGLYMKAGGMANIQSKRGCPFACTYCTYPALEGSILRLREASEVVEELKEMSRESGIKHVFFVDDIFNFPSDHAVSLCEEMIKKAPGVLWSCFATPRGMTLELAGLMKRAGCVGIEFGSDSGSEKTLKGLGKHFTPEDIAYSAEYCRKVDLPNAHYIIIGGPDEEDSTLSETFGLFEKSRPTAVIAMVGVRVYPNTRLLERALMDAVLEKDRDLLSPVFYISPLMDSEKLFIKVAEHAGQQDNWVVPGLSIRSDSGMLASLRKLGKKGPLWDMLS